VKNLSELWLTAFHQLLLTLTATWRRWSIPLGLLSAAFTVQALAAFRPELTERFYSRGLYPRIARRMAFVNKFFSFSIAELIVLMALLAAGVGAVWLTRKILQRQIEWQTLLRTGSLFVMWIAAGGMTLLLLVWSLNYERLPLMENLQLERRAASADELETISRRLIAEINQSYDEARASSAQIKTFSAAPNAAIAARTQLPFSRQQLYEIIEAAYRQTPLPGVRESEEFGRPKPVRFSRVLTRLGISGIFFPFTGEANFNTEQPDCDLPFSIAHEMAHQRGFAREDEANFIAFLVCTNSSNAYVRYSGYLNAVNVVGALARVAPDRLPFVYRTLGAGARADLLARYTFWTNYRGKLSATSHLINDAYLKVNRIKSGSKNYNEMSALVVGYYLKRMTAEHDHVELSARG
jgi:hypothetical protein